MKNPAGLKRKIIQIAAFGFSNIHIGNFASGSLYQGKWKYFCNPGMNCYSCPAATLSCPIGAMQAVSTSPRFGIGFLALGFVLALGVIFGRLICGFICPFGLIQELIAKIPVKKRKLPRGFRYVKYFVLIIFVFLLPPFPSDFSGFGLPAFCKFICPVGILEGALPLLFANPALSNALGPFFIVKLIILFAVIIACIFVERFFCKVLCPLGAIYGLLNHISIIKLKVDEKSCVSCNTCSSVCPMDVDPLKEPDSSECIRCMKCAHSCPSQAISLGLRRGYSMPAEEKGS